MFTEMSGAEKSPSPVELIKESSDFLRGSITSGLNETVSAALAEDDTHLTKFHGIYQQDDRDLRSERKKQRLEPAYSFMIRARVPAGTCTPQQWLAMDELARRYANGTLRLTTRQAFQLHGVIKRELKQTVAAINDSLLDTLAACGDVNRNVMSSVLPELSDTHAEVAAHARQLSAHLTPATGAYHEIWLAGEKVVSGRQEHEPIYGKTYLPRKFKTAFVVPPLNDVDVFAQDLGYIAVIENETLCGFNISVGGGMGMSHGEAQTFPRLADLIGFVTAEQVLAVGEAVVKIQRDSGDRSNRKHARLKYTIEDRGLDWMRNEINQRLETPLQPARAVQFVATGDQLGWQQDSSGAWHHTLMIENGRVADNGDRKLMTALREVANLGVGEFRLTPNQNLTISKLDDQQKGVVQGLFDACGLLTGQSASGLRRNAMACVGFPTCALAMAESERYLPELLDPLEQLLQQYGLDDEPIVIRMTGCPNGCARPYLAEIGLVGKGPGRYNLYLGAAFDGTRMNRLYLENQDEAGILAALDPLFQSYSRKRQPDEHFGDFLVRSGQVRAMNAGREFQLKAS
jgi:sulfite reductase (NADPH) hemoprotein beta-component